MLLVLFLQQKLFRLKVGLKKLLVTSTLCFSSIYETGGLRASISFLTKKKILKIYRLKDLIGVLWINEVTLILRYAAKQNCLNKHSKIVKIFENQR